VEDESGWMVNYGAFDKSPFQGNPLVQYRMRVGGKLSIDNADDLYWYHRDDPGDIMEYRAMVEETVTEAAPVATGTNPKHNIGSSKLPLHLASPLAIAYMSVGLANGAGKYGIANYKATPVVLSIYLSATMRHLLALLEGEEFDPVDGSPHIGAILANMAIILDARAVGSLVDDRPIPGGYIQELDNLTKIYQGVVKLHEGKNPHHYTRNNEA
jgi:hypothetical protein